MPKVATASLEDINFGVSLTTVLEKATKRGIGSAPAISLLGKSFANLEGSVRCLAPDIALADVFKSEARGIVMALLREYFSLDQAARNTMDLLSFAVSAPEQLRSLLSDAAGRQFALQLHEPHTPAGMGGQRPWNPSRGLLALGAAALLFDRRRPPH